MAEAHKINFYPKPTPPTNPRLKSFDEIQDCSLRRPPHQQKHQSIDGPKKTAIQRPDRGAHQFR